MERELENKIFMFDDYKDKDEMEEKIKKYIGILKNKYSNAIITREFYKGPNVLVKATKIEYKTSNNKKINKEKEIDEWYIRQRGER